MPEDIAFNGEFQSTLVRLGVWSFGVFYISLAAWTNYYKVDVPYFLTLFTIVLTMNLGIFLSILVRPDWPARRYLSLTLDIVSISLSIFITRQPVNPFFLLYISTFFAAGTHYGARHLFVATVEAVIAYSLVLTVLEQWSRHTFEAVFFLTFLVLLPLYQYALLQRVRWAKDEAERANEAKRNFLALMTPDLRTPLTGVVGMTELLKITPLDTEQQDYVVAISSSAMVLGALIGDILDFSKIDAARLRLEHRPFDPRTVVREVCAVLEGAALSVGVELICEVAPGVPATVTGDWLRVRQILFNLVGNAVKFTEEGEIRVRLLVRPPEEGIDRPHLLMEVEDTGIGIPADKLATIFESFRQADTSTARRFGGAGLGTTIALELARLMGGNLGVESQEGRGSRFWVRLPLIDPRTPAPAAPAARLAGRRALLLESNQTHRGLAGAALRRVGMACHELAEPAGLAALGLRAADLDCLVIADRLTGRNLGATRAELCEGLGLGPNEGLPCLYLTYAARRPAALGARAHCLGKPFLAEDLVAAVAGLLGLSSEPAPYEPQKQDFAGTTVAPVAGIRVDGRGNEATSLDSEMEPHPQLGLMGPGQSPNKDGHSRAVLAAPDSLSSDYPGVRKITRGRFGVRLPWIRGEIPQTYSDQTRRLRPKEITARVIEWTNPRPWVFLTDAVRRIIDPLVPAMARSPVIVLTGSAVIGFLIGWASLYASMLAVALAFVVGAAAYTYSQVDSEG